MGWLLLIPALIYAGIALVGVVEGVREWRQLRRVPAVPAQVRRIVWLCIFSTVEPALARAWMLLCTTLLVDAMFGARSLPGAG